MHRIAWRIADVIPGLLVAGNVYILSSRLLDEAHHRANGDYLLIRSLGELPISLVLIFYFAWRSSARRHNGAGNGGSSVGN
jgi:hypothetical protein